MTHSRYIAPALAVIALIGASPSRAVPLIRTENPSISVDVSSQITFEDGQPAVVTGFSDGRGDIYDAIPDSVWDNAVTGST